MSTQPEALRLAHLLEHALGNTFNSEAAAELRRLHATRDECERQYQAKCDEIGELLEIKHELLEALKAILENGADYTATRDQARAAIAKAKGQP